MMARGCTIHTENSAVGWDYECTQCNPQRLASETLLITRAELESLIAAATPMVRDDPAQETLMITRAELDALIAGATTTERERCAKLIFEHPIRMGDLAGSVVELLSKIRSGK
jgi:hypothetical protein